MFKELRTYIKTGKYGKLAKYFAIVLAVTYVVVGMISGISLEIIYDAMLFALIAVTLIAIETLEAVAKNRLCDLWTVSRVVYVISLAGIVVTFYTMALPKPYAYGILILVWPMIFAVPVSYIITTRFIIRTAKGNITN